MISSNRNLTREETRSKTRLETRIIQINLNHAQAAQDLLMQKMLEKEIEIAAVQEPWSTTNNDCWIKSKIGTAAILWNRDISQYQCKKIHQGLHTIAVKYKKLVIVSCYSSPNASQHEYEQLLHEIRQIVIQVKNNIVICGDFNAKSPLWSSRVENSRGKDLALLANMLDLRLINNGAVATCVRPQGSSFIDTTWSTSDIFPSINNWIVEEDEVSLSDHRYITFSISNRNIMISSADKNKKKIAWSSKRFDIDMFHSVLLWECQQLKIEDAASNYSSQELSEQLDQIMRHACDAAMPRQPQSPRRRTATYWWSEEISSKRKECILYRRKWTRYKKRLDNTRLDNRSLDSDLEKEKEYKKLKKELRHLIRKSKFAAWKSLIQTIEDDPWGLPYRLVMNKLRRNSPRITEMLDVEVLYVTLNQLFPNSRIEKGNPPELEQEWMDEWDISPAEIFRVTKKRTIKNTAPGWDGIKSIYWKNINEDMITCVANVLTVCLRQGNFPKQWKQAQLVLIPKGILDLERPKVRPICLLPEIGKIFERVVADRLLDWMDRNPDAALSPNQFGFRQQRSTIDAIVEFREFIEFAQKEDGTVIAVSLDISNAFNSLQWADICQALETKRFPAYLRKLVYNYLSERSIEYTDIEGRKIVRNIEAGVPQGSVLGPLLWNITFDKILRARVENGCRIIAYADDTLIIATGESPASAKRRMSFQLARTCKNIKDLHLEVSAPKTEIIVLTPNKKPSPLIELTVNRQLVQSKKSLKYLGVMMDDKLMFTEHMEYVHNKVTKVTKGLWRVMPNLHGPSERRRRLYANVLSSIILYAAPVWAHKALIKGRVHSTLKDLHRTVVLRVIAAYKTVAYDAAAIISRIPPYHFTAEARKRSYEQIRDLKIANQWSKKDEKIILCNENSAVFTRWKEHLTSQSVAGVRTREAIIPIWDEWIFRNHGNVSFHITQILTGHGVFYSYLRRIGRVSTDKCPHCASGKIDTMEHTLMECSAWADDREGMLRNLCMTVESLSLKTLVRAMVDSREGWKIAQTFIEKVMFTKEERERQIERETRAVSNEDDDSE